VFTVTQEINSYIRFRWILEFRRNTGWKSSGATRSSDSTFFLGPRANAKLVHKFPAPLHAPRAFLHTSISKYPPKRSSRTVIKILSNASLRLSNSKQEIKNKLKIQSKYSTYFLCYKLEQFNPHHSKPLHPNSGLPLQRTSGHCPETVAAIHIVPSQPCNECSVHHIIIIITTTIVVVP
jgi:hypothetical protein